MVKIIKSGDQFSVNAPYDADFINALKLTVPSNLRSWSKPCWIIHTKYEEDITSLILAYYGEMPYVTNGIVSRKESKILRVEYVGRCKDKGESEPVASGWYNNGWNVLIPESAMRLYFDGFLPGDVNGSKKAEPTVNQTLYQILGVQPTIRQEDLKNAFRRMSKQWHPDVCHEPNAHDMFLKVSEAYKTLSDVIQRKKYDFILSKMVDLDKYEPKKDLNYHIHNYANDLYGYRSPLRCGMLTVEGEMKFNKFFVTSISSWDDIIQDDKVMVSSWKKGDDKFTVEWV